MKERANCKGGAREGVPGSGGGGSGGGGAATDDGGVKGAPVENDVSGKERHGGGV